MFLFKNCPEAAPQCNAYVISNMGQGFMAPNPRAKPMFLATHGYNDPSDWSFFLVLLHMPTIATTSHNQIAQEERWLPVSLLAVSV